MSQPGEVPPAQVAETPQVAAGDETEKVEGWEGAPVPVEVGQEEEVLVFILVFVFFRRGGLRGARRGSAVDDVLGFFFARQDVVHPVQAAVGALAGHVGAHMGLVDVRGFGHEAEALLAVLFDVLGGAGVDEVDFEVGEVVVGVGRGIVGGWPAAVGEIPVVDVVCAEVLDGLQRGGDRREVVGRAGEGRALEDEQGRLVVDGAAEGGAAAGLVWWDEALVGVGLEGLFVFWSFGHGLGYG